MLNQVAIPQTIEEMLENKKRGLAMLADAFKMFDNAREEIGQIGPYAFPSLAGPKMDMEEIIRYIDQRMWRLAFDRTGLLQIMDAKAVKEFEAGLEKKDAPAFTMDNIRTTYLHVYQQREELFSRGIVNIFRRLCREYKTNAEAAFRIPEGKIIVTWWAERSYGGKGLRIRYERQEEVNDLDRVIKILDGKQHIPQSLHTAINAAWGNDQVFEDDYYQFKGYKNGNAHVKFKRPDIIEKANELIHNYYNGNSVPDARRTA